MKEEKFPELSKWVKDSMNCDPHIFAEGELQSDSAQMDSVGIEYPKDFMNEKPVTPQDEPDKNDLREKPSAPSNAPQPDKAAATTAPKVELKPQPNNKPASTKPMPTPVPAPTAPKPTTPPSVKPPKINIGN
jgi:hypothetical protein